MSCVHRLPDQVVEAHFHQWTKNDQNAAGSAMIPTGFFGFQRELILKPSRSLQVLARIPNSYSGRRWLSYHAGLRSADNPVSEAASGQMPKFASKGKATLGSYKCFSIISDHIQPLVCFCPRLPRDSTLIPAALTNMVAKAPPPFASTQSDAASPATHHSFSLQIDRQGQSFHTKFDPSNP